MGGSRSGSFVRDLFRTVTDALRGEQSEDAPPADATSPAGPAAQTVEIDPRVAPHLRLTYAPDPDGDPDAGEIVWTWVPYAENDGRGKDRPVLIIGRQDASHVYAVKLTSKSHDGDRDFLPLGTGEWDPAGRASWVDVDQLYCVPVDRVRREASALDIDRFTVVARALQGRYGWEVGS